MIPGWVRRGHRDNIELYTRGTIPSWITNSDFEVLVEI